VTEQSTGAYAPGYPSGDDPSKAQQVAGQAKTAATHAATDIKDTAAEQAQRVGHETKVQVRSVVSDVRQQVGQQARTQNDKLVGSIRQTADHLDEMRSQHGDTPTAAVVARVADGGRQLADYLDRNGPDGVLREVEDFARRRPGAFLATALVAGFVVGRLGKGVAKADPDAGKPAGDSFTSSGGSLSTGSDYAPAADYGTTAAVTPDPTLGYPATGTEYTPTGTEYAPTGTEYTSTGTGTPVVADEYPLVERRP
jgi:hypothetical protein